MHLRSTLGLEQYVPLRVDCSHSHDIDISRRIQVVAPQGRHCQPPPRAHIRGR